MATESDAPAAERRVIERLIQAEPYQQLLKRTPVFDLFRILGRLTENPSSRALAYLLDSSQDHGLRTLFLETLLQGISLESGECPTLADLQRLLQEPGIEISCTREWSTGKQRRLDILARLFNSQRDLIGVLGIENKHWSDEQDAQVSDYQCELTDRFPGNIPRLLVFLSPGARRAWSAKRIAGCPHVEVSYLAATAALRSCSAKLQGPLSLFVTSLANHLETRLENGGNMNSDVRARVCELYQDPDHRKAIDLLLKNLPTLRAILPRIEERISVEQGLGCRWKTSTYPSRATVPLKEVYFNLVDLRPLTKGHGFTLKYVLHPDYREIGWRSPGIGDQIFVQLAAWCKTPAAKQAVRQLQRLGVVPAVKGPLYAFEKWNPIWSAGSYTLRDFGEQDVQSIPPFNTTS
jgi:hypothetical protein